MVLKGTQGLKGGDVRQADLEKDVAVIEARLNCHIRVMDED